MVAMIRTCLLATCTFLPLQAVQLKAHDLKPELNITTSIWLPDVKQQPETEVSPPTSGSPLAHGLVFIKTPKAAGSTLDGAIRRLAYKNGVRGSHVENWLEGNIPMPFVAAYQTNRSNLQKDLDKRLPKAFYFTIVRDPAERQMSAYNYAVHENKATDGRKGLLKWLDDKGTDVQAQYLSPTNDKEVMNRTSGQDLVKLYDFVAVTERFDESLLILARKLRNKKSKEDVLYMPSKKAGTSCGGRIKAYTPLKEQPQVVLEAAEKFRHGKDADLYAAANKALDKAILKYKGFDKDLKEFRHQLAVIAEECSEYACDQCMWGDNGCGQVCIEEVIKKHNW